MSQIASVPPVNVALVAALAALAALLALALQPSPVAAQPPAFEEQYEFDFERSPPSSPRPREAAPARPAAPPERSTPPIEENERWPQRRQSSGDAPAGTGVAGTMGAIGAASVELGGYPLTPLLLLLIATLLGGLAVRAGLAVRVRLSGRHPGPPGGAA